MRAREVLVWQEFGGWAGGEDPNLSVPRSFRILRDGIFEVETRSVRIFCFDVVGWGLHPFHPPGHLLPHSWKNPILAPLWVKIRTTGDSKPCSSGSSAGFACSQKHMVW